MLTVETHNQQRTGPHLASVIIPTYNRAQYVVQAIESVQSQTYSNVEIIVVDDGSTDDTIPLLRKVKGIKLIEHEHKGMTASRNLGLAHASGKYVCCLDSDDIWKSNFLADSIEVLETLNAEFVFSNWIAQNIDGQRYDGYFEAYYDWSNCEYSAVTGWQTVPPAMARAVLLEGCPCPSSGLVFRTEHIRAGWAPGLLVADDWCLLLDIALARPSLIAFTTERNWIKRVLGDNLCDGRTDEEIQRLLWYGDYWRFFKRFSKQITSAERAVMARKLARTSAQLAKIDWEKGNHSSAANCALSAVSAVALALANAPIETVGKLLGRCSKTQDTVTSTSQI